MLGVAEGLDAGRERTNKSRKRDIWVSHNMKKSSDQPYNWAMWSLGDVID